MSAERGHALLEVAVIGMVVTLLVAQVVVLVGRMGTAGEAAEGAARAAAVVVARDGDLDSARTMAAEMAPGAAISIVDEGERVTVEVLIEVALVGPAGSPLTTSVRGVATAPRSPYRSDP